MHRSSASASGSASATLQRHGCDFFALALPLALALDGSHEVTVPIQISWDLYLGRTAVWCECIAAGARRAVLLPRLDVIFSPVDEDPGRELVYGELDWRLVSPTDSDWVRYIEMAEKQAAHARVSVRVQRVENVARWMGGRQVAVPQYHIWLFRDADVRSALDKLYEESDPQVRRGLWQWLLAWTAPMHAVNPTI